MDNLTHSLVGALLGQMGLKRKTGLAMPTLIIAANIPDIDAVTVLLGGNQHLALRRGLTHGPIAMVFLPLLLWGAMLWFDRWQTRRGKRPEKRLPVHKGWLLALAYIGCLTHPALDWLNSYGIRLLEPFSHQWFYGDSIFIIDIWIWIALIVGVWFSLRLERRGKKNWQQPAWISFTAICAYIFANAVITDRAESVGIQYARSEYPINASMPDPLVVANPVPIAFWRREVILETDPMSYSIIPFSLFSNFKNREVDIITTKFQKKDAFKIFPKNSKTLNFLFWARLPYFELEEHECGAVPCPFDSKNSELAFLRDARFHENLVKERFSVSVILPPLDRIERK
jgi:inner membrane protein